VGGGQAEPLENAAEAAGASEAAEPLFSGFLPGYTLDGLNPYLGTLLSALLGSGLVLVIALGLGRLLSDSDAN
jgi:cobalt/nickel transport protein